ncbi:MAG TPA: ABC transporter substrate-binding protein [Verrucomicrobiae bacterium]|jgi:NitT/TauT family transport system substrate-binding protein|nr:ABC transporter substrate-binding protein [Verrucomicrobiae bacterium]
MKPARPNKKILACRNGLLALCVLLVAVAVGGPSAHEAAAQPRSKNITIVYAGTSTNQAPGWVAYEAGIFRKYGLEVQLVHVTGGPKAVQVLASGYATLGQVAGAPVVQSILQGSDVVLIGGILNTMNYQFIVDKNIQRPEDLKGKSVAVSRAGSSSDFATRFALDKYGLVPGKDVGIVEIGTQPERFAALESGRVHGVMLEAPQTLKAKRMGLRVMADLQMLGLEYQATGLATTRSLIKSRPEMFRNLMKAYAEAIYYYKTHPRESIAVLQKYLKIDDMDALQEAYEAVGLTLVPEKPYPTLKGIQMILGELAGREPKAQTAKPDQFVDLTFIKELDASGFIDRLYKGKPVIARNDAPKPQPPSAKETTAVSKANSSSAEKKSAPAAAKPAPLPAAMKSAAQEYTVKAGDTLGRLAQKYYGDIFKWTRIYEANRQTLKTPDYIFVGQKLLIPGDDVAGTFVPAAQ